MSATMTSCPGSRANSVTPSRRNPIDLEGRALGSLRLSVTDRCNLRCTYCMPDEPPAWLPNPRLLAFEELAQLVDAFQLLGVRRVRLTGGEPLLRRGLEVLVAELARRAELEDLSLTTNGMRLEELARPLREAGLRRVNVSLDTLRPERFLALSRRPGLEQVLRGIRAARDAGLAPLKLDTVVIRQRNEDELVELLDYAGSVGAELRFIEYMDVSGGGGWSPEAVVTRAEMLWRLRRALGPIEELAGRGSAPAERFRLRDGRTFGIIASVSRPFCGACDRARLTADGTLFSCLFGCDGLDLRTPLRSGASAPELARLVRQRWMDRDDRGAEQRAREDWRRPTGMHARMSARGG